VVFKEIQVEITFNDQYSETFVVLFFYFSFFVGDEGKHLFIDTHGTVHMN